MIKRPFIRSPLWAAIAAQEFGMRFVSADSESILFYSEGNRYYWRYEKGDESKIIGFIRIYTGEQFYIHPDSLHLLDPQVDDLVLIGADLPYWICHDSDYDRPALKETLKNGAFPGFMSVTQASVWIDDREGQIIQRNGKPFPPIEWEED